MSFFLINVRFYYSRIEVKQNCSAFFGVSFSGQKKSERIDRIYFTEKENVKNKVQMNRGGRIAMEVSIDGERTHCHFLTAICSMQSNKLLCSCCYSAIYQVAFRQLFSDVFGRF